MKFKERLEIVNEINSIKEDSDKYSYNDLLNIFEKNTKAEEIIKKVIHNNKNIILACSKENQKINFADYIKLIIQENDFFESIYKISENINYTEKYKIFSQTSDTIDFVKILGLILTGYKKFIFSINIKEFENITDNIKTLISIYYPNLTESNINHLLSESQAVIIFFTRNEDGLYTITNIAEFINSKESVKLKTIYTYNPKDIEKIETETETEIKQNKKKKETIKEIQKEEQTEPINEEKKKPQKSTVEDNNTGKYTKVLTNKVNKYKLLKLKLKNKSNSNNLL